MDVKKIIAGTCAALLTVGLLIFVVNERQAGDKNGQTEVLSAQNKVKPLKSNDKKRVNDTKTVNSEKQDVMTASVEVNSANEVNNANMYNNVPSAMLPLSAVAELSSLPDGVKSDVEKILDTNTIYVIEKNHDRLFIVTDNQDNIRHGVEFVEISLKNGHQIKSTLGYNGKIKDSENDKWEFDSETAQPKKHIKYDKSGDVEFVEEWSYDEENPVKYEMKDGEGNVISLRKEVLEDGTNLRVEHLVYDKKGTTKVNVSTTYEGADLKRFTYYNADKPDDSISVFGEYSDGQKMQETVFTSDLKVKNVYRAEYKDGNKEAITVFDENNNEVRRYTAD